MKDARAVVMRVRGTGLKCDRCTGAQWRRKAVRFMIQVHEVPLVGYAVMRHNQVMPFVGVCRDHLRDAVLEVWK